MDYDALDEIGARMRLLPALYDLQMRLMAKRINPLRRLVVGGANGRVLEIGVGTGLNLPHYPPATVVVAVDPDREMLKRARPRATESPARIHLVVAAAEALPFRDGVFDTATATLVFCSVKSPQAAFAEARRVLRPAGALRFLEHVRSASPGWARFQDLVTPAWNVLAGGCCPNRPTVQTMEAGGFVVESLDRFPLGPYPTRPQVLGAARRQEV